MRGGEGGGGEGKRERERGGGEWGEKDNDLKERWEERQNVCMGQRQRREVGVGRWRRVGRGGGRAMRRDKVHVRRHGEQAREREGVGV